MRANYLYAKSWSILFISQWLNGYNVYVLTVLPICFGLITSDFGRSWQIIDARLHGRKAHPAKQLNFLICNILLSNTRNHVGGTTFKPVKLRHKVHIPPCIGTKNAIVLSYTSLVDTLATIRSSSHCNRTVPLANASNLSISHVTSSQWSVIMAAHNIPVAQVVRIKVPEDYYWN